MSNSEADDTGRGEGGLASVMTLRGWNRKRSRCELREFVKYSLTLFGWKGKHHSLDPSLDLCRVSFDARWKLRPNRKNDKLCKR